MWQCLYLGMSLVGTLETGPMELLQEVLTQGGLHSLTCVDLNYLRLSCHLGARDPFILQCRPLSGCCEDSHRGGRPELPCSKRSFRPHSGSVSLLPVWPFLIVFALT